MSSSDSGHATQEKLGLPGDPCAMVIFGAGGDLTKRKLMPALYNLYQGKLLPAEFAIIGISIEPYSDDEFRQYMTKDIAEYSEKGVDLSIVGMRSSSIFTTSAATSTIPSCSNSSAKHLSALKRTKGPRAMCLFYLATARLFFQLS